MKVNNVQLRNDLGALARESSVVSATFITPAGSMQMPSSASRLPDNLNGMLGAFWEKYAEVNRAPSELVLTFPQEVILFVFDGATSLVLLMKDAKRLKQVRSHARTLLLHQKLLPAFEEGAEEATDVEASEKAGGTKQG